MRLDMKARQSLVRVIAGRYQRASRNEKRKILDEFVQSTGYHRCYASFLLSRHGKPLRVDSKTTLVGDVSKRVRKKREPIYGADVLKALKIVWMNLDFMCGKRLKAAITETVAVMERWGEMNVSAETKGKLNRISAATIDRLLGPERKRLELKSRSGTKPGTLLKHQVEIRTFADWDENKPGFAETDLVSHGGGDERGDFCQTLCLTDVCSAWTEAEAVRNKAQVWVFEGLENIRQRLPFDLLGLDSDNGSEFINGHLIAYCKREGITFTRSRPYRKNDNCFVEEKNYTLVRRAVGYMRHDTPGELQILNRLYYYVCLRSNYFLPTMKLTSKQRIGSKVVKRYLLPETPYQRLLGSPDVPDQAKQQLKQKYQELNPAQLTREIARLQQTLWKAVQKKRKKKKAA
ncbi:MAG: transposase family protein [Acidobacteriota bacterium]